MTVRRTKEYCCDVVFDIEHPNGIRNSNKALKNLLKQSPQLRCYVIEALTSHMQTETYSNSSRSSYAISKTLGKTCYVHVYFGADREGQPIEPFLDNLLRKSL